MRCMGAAFTEGRKAVSLLEDLRRRAPQHHESALLPGIYRFALSLSLNYGFYNSQETPANIAAPYEMRLTGIGDIGIGGISAAQNMLDLGPRFTVDASHTLAADRPFLGVNGELRLKEAVSDSAQGLP